MRGFSARHFPRIPQLYKPEIEENHFVRQKLRIFFPPMFLLHSPFLWRLLDSCHLPNPGEYCMSEFHIVASGPCTVNCTNTAGDFSCKHCTQRLLGNILTADFVRAVQDRVYVPL